MAIFMDQEEKNVTLNNSPAMRITVFVSVALVSYSCALITPFHLRHPGLFDPSSIAAEPHHRQHAARLRRKAVSQVATCAQIASGAVTSPADYGADLTGVNDTSWAFSKAVAALVALAPTSRTNDQGMIDLGGAALDLKSGIYLISSPVVLPPGYANFKLRSGSLVAGSAFPPDRYMVEVGGSCSGGGTTPGVSAKNCNTDVDIESLTLDGRATAFGGLLVNHTMNVNVGPALMIYGWTGVGISLQGSGAGCHLLALLRRHVAS